MAPFLMCTWFQINPAAAIIGWQEDWDFPQHKVHPMRISLASLLTAAVLAASPIAGASVSIAADAAGNWKDPDTGAVLTFFDCSGDLCAKIMTASKPGLKDDKNPDEAKRSQPLEGLAVLDHAKKAEDGSWKGNLYNATDGKTYAGYVTVPAIDKLQLKGCALVVFCKAVVFDKIAAQ